MTNRNVPDSTKVWQHVVILPEASIGENGNICSHVFIENDVVIGDDVTIKNGCLIYDGVRIGRGAFIGPGVVFTNDRYPRARGYDKRVIKFEPTIVEEGVAIGANSTIICGVTIGKDAMIGAGSVVTRDIPAGAKAFGNPARVIGRAPDVRTP